jgi:hypothetical protein
MILYNVTAAVDDAVHDEWLEWIKNTHIPEVLATGRFIEHKIFKVLLNQDEGTSYSIQYFAETMAELQLYEALHAEALRQKHAARYGEKVLTFRTVLEELV